MHFPVLTALTHHTVCFISPISAKDWPFVFHRQALP